LAVLDVVGTNVFGLGYICKIWHIFAYFSATKILTYSMQNVKP